MKYITLVMLTRAKACADQQELFKSTFGKKVELTIANMAKATEVGLRFEWLVRLLTQPALETYKEKQEPLWEAYWSQYVFLRKSYVAQRALLSQAYEEQMVPLVEAYEAQRNTLLLSALIAD